MSELNFVDGLYRYQRPGFNAMEREWYHQHVISQEALLLKYQQLAEKIAADKNVDISSVYDQLLTMGNANKAELLSYFGPFFVDVQLIQQEQSEHGRNAPDLAAEMILRSRLKPRWLKANEEAIFKEYGEVWSEEELVDIANLPRAKWLDDPIRQEIIKRILIPSWQVRALKEFVDNELLEGENPQLQINSPDEVLGKLQTELEERKLRSQPKDRSLNEPTEAAKPTG